MKLHGGWLLAGLVCLIIGCGPGGPVKPKLYPVTGKLTIGGKPAADITVQFSAVGSSGTGYSGKTNASGDFTLSDPQDQQAGAAAGKYKIVLQLAPEAAMKAMMSGAQKGPGGVSTGAFPDEYKSPETSPKEVEVKAESQTINIEIP